MVIAILIFIIHNSDKNSIESGFLDYFIICPESMGRVHREADETYNTLKQTATDW